MLAVEIWMDLLKGLQTYLSSGVEFPLNFQRLLAAKLYAAAGTVLEVQEHARGPLSPCQIWWGLDFTHHWAAKKVEFFVCLSVTITLLNVRVCAPDFAMKVFEYRNDFDAIG